MVANQNRSQVRGKAVIKWGDLSHAYSDDVSPLLMVNTLKTAMLFLICLRELYKLYTCCNILCLMNLTSAQDFLYWEIKKK